MALYLYFRFTADSTMPDNLVAQHAMNVTIFHWGIHRRAPKITLFQIFQNYLRYVGFLGGKISIFNCTIRLAAYIIFYK